MPRTHEVPRTTSDPDADPVASSADDSAQSPDRAPHDMLPPSVSTPEAPGRTGLASEPSPPVTHRRTPEEQNPTPSQHWFPPVNR